MANSAKLIIGATLVSLVLATQSQIIVCNSSSSSSSGDGDNSSSFWSRLIYDDIYMTRYLDARYPYLKQANGTYLGVRDYFNFSLQYKPTREYTRQINIEQYLYNEFRAVEFVATRHHGSLDIWQYSNKDELIKSGWPNANEHKCQEELAYLSGAIIPATSHSRRQQNYNSSFLFSEGEKNIELLRWIDSWGRPVSETYYGNSFWLGSYRGCMEARVARVIEQEDNDTDDHGGGATSKIEFRYCWAKLRAKDWPQQDEFTPSISIKVGTCLPKSCDTLMANANKLTIFKLMQFNFSPMHKERFNKLVDFYCLPDHREQQLSLETKLFIGFSSIWLGLVLISSIILALFRDNFSVRSKIPTAIKCVTLQVNWNRFVAENKPQPEFRIDLRVLDLFKLLGSLGVCMGHVCTESYMAFHASSFLLIENRKLRYHLVGITTKTLELFLILSGMLSSFVIVSRFPRNKIKQILKPQIYIGLNLARYLRLAPTLIFVIAFIKSSQVYLSEGPFWDYGTSRHSQHGVCRQLSWWRVLLWPVVFDWSTKSSNSSPYHVECFPPSWFIITEMKIFSLVPIYIYFIYTKKQWRLRITALAVIISTLWQFKDLLMQRVFYTDQLFTYGKAPIGIMLIKFTESSYFSPINRFHSTAIGLLAGIYLYDYKSNLITNWSKWFTSNWILWAGIGWHIFDWFGPMWADRQFRATGVLPNEQAQQLMIILKPRIDSVTMAIFVLRCVSEWAPSIMQNTSHLVYKLSKLSYCIFCIHPILFTYFMSSTEHSRPDSNPQQIVALGVFLVVISVVMALPLFVLVESPLELLLNHLGDREKFRDKIHRLEWANLDVSCPPAEAGRGGHDDVNGKEVKKEQ